MTEADRYLDIGIALNLSVEEAIHVMACVSVSAREVPQGSVAASLFSRLAAKVEEQLVVPLVDYGIDTERLTKEVENALAIMGQPDR